MFDEVPDEAQFAPSTISVRSVCKDKTIDDMVTIKARLVARGFEEGNATFRKDSPICSKENLRLAVIISSSKHWNINSLDIQ